MRRTRHPPVSPTPGPQPAALQHIAMDFEALLEAFYRELELSKKTVIDVGAHVGRHALPLAAKVGKEGIVHAFEPIPTIRSQLVANALAAGANNIIVYPFALSEVNGLADFQFIPNLPEESGLKARHIYNAVPDPVQLIPVQQHCLDDLLPEASVAFMKIDIEGGELDMLKGSRHLLRRARPIVAFECGAASFLGYHDHPQDLFQLFTDADYAVFSIHGDRIASPESFREKTFAQNYWDYIASPSEKCAAVMEAFTRRASA
jgi:FkbM family methyltransferase